MKFVSIYLSNNEFIIIILRERERRERLGHFGEFAFLDLSLNSDLSLNLILF